MFNLTPFRRNNDLTNDVFTDVEKLFDDFFSESFSPMFLGNKAGLQVNISETESAYEVVAQVPGVNKEEIKVDVDNDVLTISVNHKEEFKEDKEHYLRREHKAYNMKRSFQLGNVKDDEIKGKLDRGVLTLTLPKKEISKPQSRSIEIE